MWMACACGTPSRPCSFDWAAMWCGNKRGRTRTMPRLSSAWKKPCRASRRRRWRWSSVHRWGRRVCNRHWPRRSRMPRRMSNASWKCTEVEMPWSLLSASWKRSSSWNYGISSWGRTYPWPLASIALRRCRACFSSNGLVQRVDWFFLSTGGVSSTN